VAEPKLVATRLGKHFCHLDALTGIDVRIMSEQDHHRIQGNCRHEPCDPAR
jgi:hypothetical protein